jgi:phosphoglycolate phosphatase
MRRLVLFDVDGTLIKRGDPDHLAAMDYGVHSAFPEAKASSIADVDFDGKVDRIIASEILSRAGIDVPSGDSQLDPVFEHASSYYQSQWESREHGTDDLLPGVNELIPAMAARPDEFALGVLTGGSRAIVEVKLRRLGLSEYIPIGSFGDEVPTRPDLVPLAIERAEAHYGESFGSDRTVIVGDTPHDVHCAHVHRVACLGVATGKFREDDLSEADADEVVADLSDIDSIIGILSTIALTRA